MIHARWFLVQVTLGAILGWAPAEQLPPYVTPQGMDISGDGRWLLHVEEKGVWLLDLKDPRKPECLSGRPVPGHGSDGKFLSIGGQCYAVVADGLGLSTFTVGPGGLEPLARLEMAGDNLRGPESLVVDGTTGFAACRLSGLAIVDLSRPAEPKTISLTPTKRFARKIAVALPYVYIADSRGMSIMTTEDPRQPKLVSFLPSPDLATDVTVRGNIAALGCGKNWLLLTDISDAAKPRELGRFRGKIVWYGSFFFDSEITDKSLHIAFGEGGYLRLDLSDAAQPRWVSEYHPRRDAPPGQTVFADALARALVARGPLVYLGHQGYIEVLDIQHPSDVTRVVRVDLPPKAAGSP